MAGAAPGKVSSAIKDTPSNQKNTNHNSDNSLAIGTNQTVERIGLTVDGKYLIVAKLGAGGMGAVYRAQRLMIGDEVAIKILHPGLVSDSQATERFRREAQAAARLQHANAVSIYDFGVTQDGTVYLVMELLEGDNLRQLIRKLGPFQPSTAVDLIKQVCSVLEEAHDHHIIHRDIKPDNIMVSTPNGGLRVKVLDFGIAKLRDVATTNLTQAGSVVGTPHYMSPEQCLGQELDTRSDIYSLGIVLYEMLAGVVPFNSRTSTAIVVQHVNQPPPSLRAINLGISEDLERVVFHALQKRPELRPKTAIEFGRELDEAVSLKKEQGPVPAQPYDASGSSQLSQSSGFTPTVVLPKPAAGVSSRPVSNSASQPDRSQTALIAVGVLAVLLVGIVLYLLIRSDDSSQNASAFQPGSAAPSQTTVRATQQPAVAVPTANTEPAKRRTICKYSGVNIRELPQREAPLITTIGRGVELIILQEANQLDTVFIPSERRSVTDNWSEVALAANPSIRGWVFSGFITKN